MRELYHLVLLIQGPAYPGAQGGGMVSSCAARSQRMMVTQNGPEGGPQNTHVRGVLMATRSG